MRYPRVIFDFFKILNNLELPLVALAVGLTLIKTSILPIAIIVGICFWIIRWFVCKYLSLHTPVDWLIFLFLLILPITIWISPLREKTLTQIYRLLTGITLFYAVINWSTNKRRIEWLFMGVIALGAIFSLLAPFMVKWETHKVPFFPAWIYQRFVILVSDTVNPGVMAGSLVILIPFALAIILFSWSTLSKINKLLILLSSILMVMVLTLTQSRGGWLAFCVVLAILPVFRWRYGWIGLLIFWGVFIFLTYRFGFKHVLDLLIASQTLQSLDGRIEVWSRAIYMIKDFSWTGVGLGLFGDVADKMYPVIQYPPGSIFHAHNLFLQVAVDLGIPGLIAWLAIGLLVLFAGWRVYRIGCYRNDCWVVGLGVAIVCSQVALGVYGIGDAPYWGMIRTVPIIWAVWGLAMASLYVFNSNYIENAKYNS